MPKILEIVIVVQVALDLILDNKIKVFYFICRRANCKKRKQKLHHELKAEKSLKRFSTIVKMKYLVICNNVISGFAVK